MEKIIPKQAKLIAFDCIKCSKTLQLDEATYEEYYKDHDNCMQCRPWKVV